METLVSIIVVALLAAIVTRAFRAGREKGNREGYLQGYQDGLQYKPETGTYKWDPNNRPKLHKVQA